HFVVQFLFVALVAHLNVPPPCVVGSMPLSAAGEGKPPPLAPARTGLGLAGVVQPHKRTGFVRVPGDRCPVRPVADDTHVRTHLDVCYLTISVACPVCGVGLPDVGISGAAPWVSVVI